MATWDFLTVKEILLITNVRIAKNGTGQSKYLVKMVTNLSKTEAITLESTLVVSNSFMKFVKAQKKLQQTSVIQIQIVNISLKHLKQQDPTSHRHRNG